MSTHGGHEVYPNPSIALVVLEVRFPPTTTEQREAQLGLRKGLRADFPLFEQAVEQSLSFDSPAGGGQLESRLLFRYSRRDRTASVAVTPEAVVIETTEYLGFEWYLDFIRGPLAVVAEVLDPDGVSSIGHRFIDEVRVPHADGLIDWSRWIEHTLLTPGLLPLDAGLSAPERWQGAISYQTSAEATLTLRYGALEGAAVPANGATRREDPVPSGPFFLLDWDSRANPTVTPEFAVDDLLHRCAELYEPVRAMYHHVTTDALREVFLTDDQSQKERP